MAPTDEPLILKCSHGVLYEVHPDTLKDFHIACKCPEDVCFSMNTTQGGVNVSKSIETFMVQAMRECIHTKKTEECNTLCVGCAVHAAEAYLQDRDGRKGTLVTNTPPEQHFQCHKCRARTPSIYWAPNSTCPKCGANRSRMIRHTYDHAGLILIRKERADPNCGEDFCNNCGDCLACYREDPCGNPNSTHFWVKYGEDPKEAPS